MRAPTSSSPGSPFAPIRHVAVPNVPGFKTGTAFGGSSRENGPWRTRGVITTSLAVTSPRFRTVTRYTTCVASKSIPGSTRTSSFLGGRFGPRRAARAMERRTAAVRMETSPIPLIRCPPPPVLRQEAQLLHELELVVVDVALRDLALFHLVHDARSKLDPLPGGRD